jgi:predicted methyltransferase
MEAMSRRRPIPGFVLRSVVLAGVGLLAVRADAAPQATGQSRLFPPEQLGQLEGPDRDEWQQPERVMDALGIADGAHVADLGAGGGWFTIRLARRVGPNGVVYAEDVQTPMIEAIERRAAREGLGNVRTILGGFTDPALPAPVQAALLVDLYSQIQEPVALLKNIRKSLAPNGRLGVIDFKPGQFGPGPDEGRVPPDKIIADAASAGLRLVRHDTFLRYQYLLIFTAE